MATLSIDSVLKSAGDKRGYRGLVLENGLQVLLVRDQETKKAAAALAVGVGASEDPAHLPGLAHFTEHMCMQGSDLFPGDNEYKALLSTHGGASNATTSMEHTWYRFSVADESKQGEATQQVLDVFSRFFVAPTFNPDFVAREVLAIDAEDSKNRTSDDRRLLQVLKAITRPECSYSKYSTGSAATLRDAPSHMEPPVQTHSAMRSFHAKHYTAPNMALCLVANQELDTLEKWVSDRFHLIPSSSPPSVVDELIASAATAADPPPLPLPPSATAAIAATAATSAPEGLVGGPARLGEKVWVAPLPRLVKFAPLRELRRLALIWEIPVQREHWRRPPTRLLAHLLGHEGPGSAFAVLQDLGWATGLSAGERIDQPDVCAFQVRVDLTSLGEAKWEEVAKVVFDSVRLLQAASWSLLEQHWREVAATAQMHHDHSEPAPALSVANELCKKVLLFGAQHASVAGRILLNEEPEESNDPGGGGGGESSQVRVAPSVEFGPSDEANVRRVLACLVPHSVVVVRTSSTAFTSPPEPTPPSPPPGVAEPGAATPGEPAAPRAAGEEAPPGAAAVCSYDLNRLEKWYGVWYGDVLCPPSLTKYWADDTLQSSRLSLPAPNKFLPGDLALVASQQELADGAEKKAKLWALRGPADPTAPTFPILTDLLGNDGDGQDTTTALKEVVVEEGDGVCSCGKEAGDEFAGGVQLARQALFARAMATHASMAVSAGSSNAHLLAQQARRAAECLRHSTATTNTPGAFASKRFRANQPKRTSGGEGGGGGGGGGGGDKKKEEGGEGRKASFFAVARTLLPPPSRVDTNFSGRASLWWDLWHKTDATHGVPKAELRVLLASPLPQREPVHATLLCRLLSHSLQQSMYPAQLAGLHWSLTPHSLGLVLRVSGFSQRAPLLAKDLAAALVALDIPRDHAARFGTVQEQLVREYRNFKLERADAHANFALRLFLETGKWDISEKQGAAENATAESLARFKGRLLKQGKMLYWVSLRGLVHGNLRPTATRDLAATLAEALTPALTSTTQPFLEHRRPSVRVVDLPRGSFHRVSFNSPSTEEPNSAMLLVFVAGQNEASPSAAATFNLLVQLVKEPCFTTLRTREQLGYVVSAREMAFGTGKGASVSALALSVLSKTTAPPQVELRALAFLEDFEATLLCTPLEAFESAKRAQVAKLLEPPRRLSSEASQWWAEVQHGDLDWNRYEALAVATESTSLEDVAALYRRLVLDADTSKRFSVHVYGNKHSLPHTSATPGTKAAAARVEMGKEATVLERNTWAAWKDSMPLLPSEVGRSH